MTNIKADNIIMCLWFQTAYYGDWQQKGKMIDNESEFEKSSIKERKEEIPDKIKKKTSKKKKKSQN